MKNKTSLRTKVIGILACLCPVIVVALLSFPGFGRMAGDYSSITADGSASVGNPKPSQLTKSDPTEVSVPDLLLDRSEDRRAQTVLIAQAQVEKPEFDLVEVDWVAGFTTGGIDLGDTIDCTIPQTYTQEFTKLMGEVSRQLDGASERQFRLGRILRKSRGSQCHALAFGYFQRSVTSGYGRGYAEIANSYRKGLGVTANFELALENFEKSARLGFVNSAYRLVEMTEKGSQVIEGDPLKASAYLDEFLPLIEGKIRQGDAIAARSLGRLYNNSNLLQQNPNKAIEFLRYAADLGDAIAMHDLALLLMQHRRVGLKRKDVFPLLLESSNLGYAAAFTAIGRLHLKEEFGFPRSEAPRWFRWGVEAGHPGSMEELAGLYFTGDIVARDIGLAKELATQGMRLKHSGSQRILSEILETENFVEDES
ncbi:MAG: tetratricopeptide repeat protein [Pseudomonadota bacterium]